VDPRLAFVVCVLDRLFLSDASLGRRFFRSNSDVPATVSKMDVVVRRFFYVRTGSPVLFRKWFRRGPHRLPLFQSGSERFVLVRSEALEASHRLRFLLTSPPPSFA